MATNNTSNSFATAFKGTNDKGADFPKITLSDPNKDGVRNWRRTASVKVDSHEKYLNDPVKNPTGDLIYEPNTRTHGLPLHVADFFVSKLSPSTPADQRDALVDVMVRFFTDNSIGRYFNDDNDSFIYFMTDDFINSPQLQQRLLSNIEDIAASPSRYSSKKALSDKLFSGIPTTLEYISMFKSDAPAKKKELDENFILHARTALKQQLADEKERSKEESKSGRASSPRKSASRSTVSKSAVSKSNAPLTPEAKAYALAKTFIEKFKTASISVEYEGDGKYVGNFVDTSGFDPIKISGLPKDKITPNVSLNSDSELTSRELSTLKAIDLATFTPESLNDHNLKTTIGKLITTHSGYNTNKNAKKDGTSAEEVRRMAADSNRTFLDLVHKLFDVDIDHPTQPVQKTPTAKVAKSTARNTGASPRIASQYPTSPRSGDSNIHYAPTSPRSVNSPRSGRSAYSSPR